MTADGLIGWLREQFDADERVARQADRERIRVAVYVSPGCYSHDLLHALRHDPAAVLADIAAKRAVLALHYTWDNDSGDHTYVNQCAVCDETAPCETVRLLASGYAHRSGYRDEWRPQ